MGRSHQSALNLARRLDMANSNRMASGPLSTTNIHENFTYHGFFIRSSLTVLVLGLTLRRPRAMYGAAALALLRLAILLDPESDAAMAVIGVEFGFTFVAVVCLWIGVMVWALLQCRIPLLQCLRVAFLVVVVWWQWNEPLLKNFVEDPLVVSLCSVVSSSAWATKELFIPTSPPSP